MLTPPTKHEFLLPPKLGTSRLSYPSLFSLLKEIFFRIFIINEGE
ncbi:hypothetical protein NOC27_2663 [Nitrosococcus oceani AFC27]|nr:hypothetical protein NOC27_2663 [Nitrosococcus oceani AFC27]